MAMLFTMKDYGWRELYNFLIRIVTAPVCDAEMLKKVTEDRQIDYYSVLKLFTGFAVAAFIAWMPTVIKATNAAKIPANINTHHCISMRYAKSFNQTFIANHATGNATT